MIINLFENLKTKPTIKFTMVFQTANNTLFKHLCTLNLPVYPQIMLRILLCALSNSRFPKILKQTKSWKILLFLTSNKTKYREIIYLTI